MTNSSYCISIHSTAVICLFENALVKIVPEIQRFPRCCTYKLWEILLRVQGTYWCVADIDSLLRVLTRFPELCCGEQGAGREWWGRASLHTVHSVTVKDIAVWYRWMEKVFCLSTFIWDVSDSALTDSDLQQHLLIGGREDVRCFICLVFAYW